MKFLGFIVGIMFMLFSICVEASESNLDVVNLPMSDQVHEITVSKDNYIIFMLPLNQKLLEVRGDDVLLNVEGNYINTLETDNWIVSFTKKRGSSKNTKWTYYYNVKLQPKKDVADVGFEFVTDKWVHKVSLTSGMNSTSFVAINDDRFFNISALMNSIFKLDPMILMGISILIFLGSSLLLIKRGLK